MEYQITNKTKCIEKRTNNFLFKFITLSYYKRIVKREIKLANIKQTDKVLCIGGGYFPATAILIAKLTKANVVVIDNDVDTINDARNKIEEYKLSHLIQVEYIDAIHVDYSIYDVVCIANQISPKEEVFNKVRNCIDEGRIIIRAPKKCLKKCYSACIFEMNYMYIKQPFYSNIGRSYLCHVVK